MSHIGQGTSIIGPDPKTAGGGRHYYMYDGNDVALVLGRTGTSWYVRQRVLSGGLDRPLVTRLVPSAGSAARNMAFIADRQGTTLAAVDPSGLRDETAAFFGRNVFGQLEGATGTGSSSNPETGFTGASTPNQTGGFTYLRNRWYDPQSGRFLTQDPIGLAGGVNLYAYAGNNPVSFSDPYGLCQKWVSNEDDGGGSYDYDEDGSEAPSEIAAHNSVHSKSAVGRAAWNALGLFNTALELPGVKEGVQIYASLRRGGVEAPKKRLEPLDRRKPHRTEPSPSKREKHEDTRALTETRSGNTTHGARTPNKRDLSR